VEKVSSDSETESESESDEEETDSETDDTEDELLDRNEQLQQMLRMQQLQQLQGYQPPIPQQQLGLPPIRPNPRAGLGGIGGIGGLDMFGGANGAAALRQNARANAKKLKALGLDPSGKKLKKDKKSGKQKRASKLEYKRVDQLWDNTIHNYKLQDTAEEAEDEYEENLFLVRRRFDWEGKYTTTVVDIKSKLIKEALNHVMVSRSRGLSTIDETRFSSLSTSPPCLLSMIIADSNIV
jgi:hypothetical protein